MKTHFLMVFFKEHVRKTKKHAENRRLIIPGEKFASAKSKGRACERRRRSIPLSHCASQNSFRSSGDPVGSYQLFSYCSRTLCTAPKLRQRPGSSSVFSAQFSEEVRVKGPRGLRTNDV